LAHPLSDPTRAGSHRPGRTVDRPSDPTPDPAARTNPDPAVVAAAADPTPETTKARLLAAAECLLAERGFEGMSIRALAARAGTSVSAANYHFGSKLGLVSAVFVARLEPINAARLSRLQAVVERAAPDAPRLADVIESFARPSFDAWREADALGRAATPHLLAALHADPADRFVELRRSLFEPLLSRYVDVLAWVLPRHDREELRVRLQLAVGVLLHVIGGHLETGSSRPESPITDTDERLLEQAIAFMTAGLCSDAVESSTGGEARR
jgi:AcrR family transcriptional regulator